jgi:predicted secreted Zn-dependent protease
MTNVKFSGEVEFGSYSDSCFRNRTYVNVPVNETLPSPKLSMQMELVFEICKETVVDW